MRLYILSDLHAEFAPFIPDPAALAAADVVVLAGDIHGGEYTPVWARKTFEDKPIIFVAGNHEFYGRHWDRCLGDLRKTALQAGVHLLEDEAVTIGDVEFLGCTLWTDFELLGCKSESITDANRCMADYRQIAGCNPWKTIERHRVSRAWLAKKLASTPEGPRVVVTHHYPSQRSMDAKYAADPVSAAFGSDLPPTFFERADVWVHGHTHTSFDYKTHGCRVICNPRGYRLRDSSFENGQFDGGLVVEVASRCATTSPSEEELQP